MPRREIRTAAFRNHNKPTVVSTRYLCVRNGLKMEAIRLKQNGFSYEAIAEQITQVGPWAKRCR